MSLGPAEILVPLLLMVALVFVRPRRLSEAGCRVAVPCVSAEGGVAEGPA